MTRNNDDLSDSEDDLSPDFDANPVGRNQRREPRFSAYDEDDEDEDGYEEPDRDTDYSSGYREDSVKEDDEGFEEDFPDEDEPARLSEDDDDPEYHPSSIEGWHSESSSSGKPDKSAAQKPDAWLEREGYLEEDDAADEDSEQKWPISLIAVAIVALVLLTAGGYGVMQQRTATQEELRQLRATLATSANTQAMSAGREALQNLQQSYDKLSANAEALTLENRRLADTVAGLQAQLGVQQAVLTKAVPAAKPVKPEAATTVASVYVTKPPPSTNKVEPATVREAASLQPVAPKPVAPEAAATKPVATRPATPQPVPSKPAAAQSAAVAPSGPWFVNFASYSSRSTAETWAKKLSPGAGRVVIAPSAKGGQTLYRVRVVGLTSRDSAQEVARKLEAELRVAALWVGRE